jgi:hypothetical protein
MPKNDFNSNLLTASLTVVWQTHYCNYIKIRITKLNMFKNFRKNFTFRDL